MSRGRKYPAELRARAVKTVIDSGRPVAQVAKDLDVGPESLRAWVRQAEIDAGNSPGAATSENLEELRRLRSENRELRRTVQTLKAASVYFARELDGTPRR